MRKQPLTANNGRQQRSLSVAATLLIYLITVDESLVEGQSTDTVISVSLTTFGSGIAGGIYSLECSVNVTGTRNQSFTVIWLDPTNNPVSSEAVTRVDSISTLTFNPLAATNAGLYTCSVSAGTVVQNATAFVTVKNPTITVRIDSDAARPMVGSVYTLNCVVTGVETLAESNVAYQWFKDRMVVEGQMMETLSFPALTFSDAGSYLCQAVVQSTLLINGSIAGTSGAFILTLMPTTDQPTASASSPVMTTTESPLDDVRLSFRGDLIANNSIVVISEIGDYTRTRIQCITDNPNCCSNQRSTRWFFPSGREVNGRGSAGVTIYRSRNNLGAVMLGNRNNASGPTGLYRCTIPDRSGVQQTLIVGLYSTSKNFAEIVPLTNAFKLTSVSSQNLDEFTFSLTCNSSGGPVQSVVWMRDGLPVHNTSPLVLTNTSTASYTSTLDVSGRLPGRYTCQFRGTDQQILNSMDLLVYGSASPLNVQASRSNSSSPVELSWSPSPPTDRATDITGYRIFYGNGQSLLVPSYITSIVYNFPESHGEIGETVSVRSESMHLLPSELVTTTVTDRSVSDSEASSSCQNDILVTLSIAVGVTVPASSGLTAILIMVFIGLCYWRKKKLSSKLSKEFDIKANMAYGRVTLEPETEGEYVFPGEMVAMPSHDEGNYRDPSEHDSTLYDLPASQQAESPEPAVYAVPHDATSRQTHLQTLNEPLTMHDHNIYS